MKILWDNYLDDSTVTASSENASYPVENLFHKFLEKKYVSTQSQAIVTVVFPEDRPVSMIAYGWSNVTPGDGSTLTIARDAEDNITITEGGAGPITIALFSSYELKDSGGTVVGSGTIEEGDLINATHFTEVTCRSVEVLFASNSIVYVGGLSMGSPISYDYTEANPTFADLSRASVRKTDGGQIIGKKKQMLREWRLTIPNATNLKRLETSAMLEEVSYVDPVYADLYDESNGVEPAIYGNITAAGVYQRDSRSQRYSMKMTIQEAR